MGFLQNLTDDQTAMLGCGAVLLAAFVMMSLSYHVGNAVRGNKQASRPQITPQRRQTTVVAEERRRAA
jgi:hypothetical protein